MRRILSCAVLLSLSLSSALTLSAQKYTVTLGPPESGKIVPYEFISSDSAGNVYVSGIRKKTKMMVPLLVYNYSDKRVEKFIKTYGADMKPVADNPITPAQEETSKDSKPVFEGRIMKRSVLGFGKESIDNVDLNIVHLWDKTFALICREEKKKMNLVAIEIDPATGATGASHTLLSFKPQKDASVSIDEVMTKLSGDESKAMIYAKLNYVGSAKKNGSVATAVIAPDMRVLWAKNYLQTKESKSLVYKSVDVGNDGTIYLLSRTQQNRRSAPVLVLSKLSADKPTPIQKNIDFGSYKVADADIALNAQNIPVVVGFYAASGKEHVYEGILSGTVGEDGKVQVAQKREFNKGYHELLAKAEERSLVTKKAKRGRGMDEEMGYNAKEVIRTDDGGLLFITEYYECMKVERKTTVVDDWGGKEKTSTRSYFLHKYGDIVITKLDEAGDFVFMRKIARNNYYESPFRNKPFEKDHSFLNTGDECYFIFNDDNDENTKSLMARSMKNVFLKDGRGATCIVKLDAVGVLTKKVILDQKKREGFSFDPNGEVEQIGDNKLAFILVRGLGDAKETRVGTITIN